NAKQVVLPNARIVSCEYSPDSKLLYLTNPGGKTIEQVEPQLPTTAAIVASKVTIPTPGSGYYGIQLAPDGKIYLAQIGTSLSTINKPTVKGTGCNYVKDQVSISPGGSYLSLPAYINDVSANPTNGFNYTIVDSCTGTVQFNGITSMSGTITWDWDFGDGNTATGQNPLHTFTPAGQSYTVKVKIKSNSGCGYIERSKVLVPGGLAATAAFDFTSKCDSGYVRFTNLSTIVPDTATVRYLWTFDDGNTSTATNPVHSYATSGVFNVRLDVLTSTPCLNRSFSQPINLEVLNIVPSPDQEIDAGQSVQLNVTGGGNTFAWSPNKWLSDSTIANPVAT
ncbi:MAG: PKD domain-containing protein, partial [Chitinophagaceae bacterium]|nr:PKD domain-containing protein [Chitinophagaceae bacterium]